MREDHLIRMVQTADPFDPARHNRRQKAWTSKRLAANPDINALLSRLRSRDLQHGRGLWIVCTSEAAAKRVKRWIDTNTDTIGRGPLITRQLYPDVVCVWEHREV